MRPDSLPRLWRYINLLLTYLLTYFEEYSTADAKTTKHYSQTTKQKRENFSNAISNTQALDGLQIIARGTAEEHLIRKF